jgi:hypothetical protein
MTSRLAEAAQSAKMGLDLARLQAAEGTVKSG